jgi:hypothetical protein
VNGFPQERIHKASVNGPPQQETHVVFARAERLYR